MRLTYEDSSSLDSSFPTKGYTVWYAHIQVYSKFIFQSVHLPTTSLFRKASPKASDVSSKEKKTTGKSALVKPSGPPHAQAKFDYSGGTDDDLTFKVCLLNVGKCMSVCSVHKLL